MHDLPYLSIYPEKILQQVRHLLANGDLASHIRYKYPDSHLVQSDRALYDYAQSLKNAHLRHAPPLNKVLYDSRLNVVKNTLGLNTSLARQQGSRLTAKNEIRIATLFKQAPAPFLRMIVVHELAHLKEKNHGKAFYQLCQHIEPDYLQLEFDLRLYLTALEQDTGLSEPN